MGECHCSNITIMQLFHELKQQFPALPDHVVSQCIAQVYRWPLSVQECGPIKYRPSVSGTKRDVSSRETR